MLLGRRCDLLGCAVLSIDTENWRFLPRAHQLQLIVSACSSCGLCRQPLSSNAGSVCGCAVPANFKEFEIFNRRVFTTCVLLEYSLCASTLLFLSDVSIICGNECELERVWCKNVYFRRRIRCEVDPDEADLCPQYMAKVKIYNSSNLLHYDEQCSIYYAIECFTCII